MALISGKSGLECYEEIANQLLSKLKFIFQNNSYGFFFLVLEVGHNQSHKVKQIFEKIPNCKHIETKLDMEFIERCLVFKFTK